MITYNPFDWYWIVDGDDSQVYASARQSYVPIDDAAYVAWREQGNVATNIDTEASLIDVLRRANVPPCNAVSTLAMVERLEAAGKLQAFDAELASRGQYAQSSWSVATALFADDQEIRALLLAAGASPDEIMAPMTELAAVPAKQQRLPRKRIA